MSELREQLRDTETEAALVGSLLVDANAIPAAAAAVRVEDFADERHAAIFAAIVAVGDAADILTVETELDRRGELGKAGGVAYLAEVSGAMPTAMNAGAYARTIAELGMRRRIVFGACTEIAKHAGDLTADAGGILDAAQAALIRAVGTAAGHGMRPMKAITGEVWQEYARRLNGEPEPGISTGLSDLDAKLRKLRPGKLVVIAGRPGTGKTTLMMQVAAHAALDQKKRVAVFTAEMSENEIAERVVAGRLRLNMAKARDHSPADAERVAAELAALSTSGLRVVYAAGWTPGRVIAEITRMHSGAGLDLVVVDYLQLLDVSGAKGMTRDAELSAATRALKTAAMRLEVPIVIGSQLNRDAVNGEPRLSNLRESGGIENDSDAVVMLHAADENNLAAIAAIVRKNRDGELGRVDLYHHLGEFRFALGERKEIATW